MLVWNVWWCWGNPSPRRVFSEKKSFNFNQKFSATFDLIKTSDESLYLWHTSGQQFTCSSKKGLCECCTNSKILFLWDFVGIFVAVVLHMASHYSVFSFHLYSNCGFLALSYIYPAIWWLLPRLTSSKHAPHKNACSSNYH